MTVDIHVASQLLQHRQLRWVSLLRAPNNAFERPWELFTSARGQRANQFAPSARLNALRPAAQRER